MAEVGLVLSLFFCKKAELVLDLRRAAQNHVSGSQGWACVDSSRPESMQGTMRMFQNQSLLDDFVRT